MDLLHFAHPLEARAFLGHWPHQYVSSSFISTGLYRSEHFYFLITGEAELQAMSKTAALLGERHQEIQRIYNLGAAGSLCPQLEAGDCLSLRQIYHQQHFQSFTTSDPQAKLDLVSASDRVLAPEAKQQLAPIAQAVDREAHAVAQVASLFKKDFYSFKVISDGLKEKTECSKIRDQFTPLGEKLLQFFLNHSCQQGPTGSMPSINSLSKANLEIKDDDFFYFTTAQKNRLNGLYKKWGEARLRELEAQARQELQALPLRPKQRTQKLLEKLSSELSPLRQQALEKIQHLSSPLLQAGWEIQVHPEWESSEIAIKANFSSEKKRQELIQGLENFSSEKWNALFQGEGHV